MGGDVVSDYTGFPGYEYGYGFATDTCMSGFVMSVQLAVWEAQR